MSGLWSRYPGTHPPTACTSLSCWVPAPTQAKTVAFGYPCYLRSGRSRSSTQPVMCMPTQRTKDMIAAAF